MWLPRTGRALREWLDIPPTTLVDDACATAIERIQELERKVNDLHAHAYPEMSNVLDRDV